MDISSEHVALGVQTKLLQSFIRLVRSSDEEGMLKTTLQMTVDLAAEITGAETGSLFLLDDSGIVTDCMMMREAPSKETRDRLIGNVLDRGLAGWVVKHRKVGLITDTLQDGRWINLPDQPYTARSAIVTPIMKGNTLFGILSLVHSAPRRFTLDTASLMKATADHIAIVLENVKLYQTLNRAFHDIERAKATIEAYSDALTAELEKGRHMQRTFLPETLPNISGWEIEACFYPARQVSGDFYDIFPISDNHIGMIIADVCDKGVSAALFMGIFRSLIHAYLEGAIEGEGWLRGRLQERQGTVTLRERAAGTLAFLNHHIQKHHGKEGIFATLFFGILTTDSGRLDYINAGHEPLMIIGSGGHVRELRPTGPAIGISPNANFVPGSERIAPGETLIGFTDGITDARSHEDKRFSRLGLLGAIQRSGRPGAHLVQSVIDEVFAHLGGGDPTDDIAMIAVSRSPKAT